MFERRLLMLIMTSDQLLAVIAGLSVDGMIPPGARLIGVHFDFDTAMYQFLIEHESFPEVQPGFHAEKHDLSSFKKKVAMLNPKPEASRPAAEIEPAHCLDAVKVINNSSAMITYRMRWTARNKVEIVIEDKPAAAGLQRAAPHIVKMAEIFEEIEPPDDLQILKQAEPIPSRRGLSEFFPLPASLTPVKFVEPEQGRAVDWTKPAAALNSSGSSSPAAVVCRGFTMQAYFCQKCKQQRDITQPVCECSKDSTTQPGVYVMGEIE